jgi:hypothetical protein
MDQSCGVGVTPRVPFAPFAQGCFSNLKIFAPQHQTRTLISLLGSWERPAQGPPSIKLRKYLLRRRGTSSEENMPAKSHSNVYVKNLPDEFDEVILYSLFEVSLHSCIPFACITPSVPFPPKSSAEEGIIASLCSRNNYV